MRVWVLYLCLISCVGAILVDCQCSAPFAPACLTNVDCLFDRVCVAGFCRELAEGGSTREGEGAPEIPSTPEERYPKPEPLLPAEKPEAAKETVPECDNPCKIEGEKSCPPDRRSVQICQRAANGCLEWSLFETCPANKLCLVGVCYCIPCGTSCCQEGEICYKNTCCTPNCQGKSCGDDGCGGSCQPGCSSKQICLNDTCCTPNCTAKPCGEDGCGGLCPSTCSSNQICQNNQCQTVTLNSGEVAVSAGSFRMGSPANELGRRDTEEPQHLVTLTRAVALWKYEVTQKEYTDLVGYNPAQLYGCGENCPVETVSWYEALFFCNKLSTSRGLPECFDCTGSGTKVVCQLKSAYSGNGGKDYYTCKGYRLPTEAEWEYAYRAGTTTAFYNGGISPNSQSPANPASQDPNLDKIGWYHENSGLTTHPVGQKLANAWGLYDMAGNVYEWVFDGWLRSYTASPIANPIEPTGAGWVARGGSYLAFPDNCRASFRYQIRPGIRDMYLGFRVCRTL